jgi:hypothetical protein
MDNLLFGRCEPHLCSWWKIEREFRYRKKSSGVENLGGADCLRFALAFDWSEFNSSPRLPPSTTVLDTFSQILTFLQLEQEFVKKFETSIQRPCDGITSSSQKRIGRSSIRV